MVEGSLLGPYKIEALIGRGGMGHVYSAVDTRLNRKVAVKVCFDSFSDRFGREAHAIAALNHPFICTLFDVGPNYLVMEYLDGETLASRLRSGPLGLTEAMAYGIQIAEALCAAHAKNIIHRDLKPANIILSRNSLKLLDFGICKSQKDSGLTSTSLVVGTVAYMAPEQLEGREATEQSDIYSLGLILSEMVGGKRVGSPEARRRDALPRELDHIIERCLARAPEDRWQIRALTSNANWNGRIRSRRLLAPCGRQSNLRGEWQLEAPQLVHSPERSFLAGDSIARTSLRRFETRNPISWFHQLTRSHLSGRKHDCSWRQDSRRRPYVFPPFEHSRIHTS